MQSMFKDENQLLTPLGKYPFWTNIHQTDRFKNKISPGSTGSSKKAIRIFNPLSSFTADWEHMMSSPMMT